MPPVKKIVLVVAAGLALSAASFFIYLEYAFPKVRCEASFKHLDPPEKYADCTACHAKITPQVAQDWFESKHGMVLVKCVVCHGQPDGTGAVPFTATPDVQDICSRCHAPAMERMYSKFGPNLDCNTCHPRHQNPLHGNAYETKLPATETTLPMPETTF